MKIHVYVPTPENLVINCSENIVTITADNATTIEYNFDGSSTYTTYTEPFAITQTVTVYAKATNAGGSITGSQVCEYVKPIDYSIPFYVEDISGVDNTVQIKKNNSYAATLTIEKSTDGKTWENMGATSITEIKATVPANGKLYLRCNAPTWASSSYVNAITITRNCNVGGNIMSLLYGSSFTGKETTFPSGSTYTFFSLFKQATHIIDSSNLILPATTLTSNCYNSMFMGCTSLTTAPVLPATTLFSRCYVSMFNGCTSLTSAPELPATTLVNYCYYSMFNGCTKLNYIKCLATDISASNCTRDWVKSVSSTGTFVKNPNMSSWSTGGNGIPSGWTVKDAGNISLEQNL